MKMITTGKVERLMPYFKVLHKKPDWFIVNTAKTNECKSYEEMIYIRAKSLDKWHEYMLANKKRGVSSTRTDERKWSGVKTWGDYLEILENGDKAVIEKIKLSTQKAVKDIEKKHQRIITQYKFDVVGEQFDIGLVLSGVPEVWLEPEYQEEEIPQITIRFNLTFSSFVKSSEVIKNCSRLLGITKVLETMGIQVKLIGINVANSYDYNHNKRVLLIENTIKDFDEPINFKKVSAYVTTAQFRRGCFHILEDIVDKLLPGYGYQTYLKGDISMDDPYSISNFEKRIFKDLKGIE